MMKMNLRAGYVPLMGLILLMFAIPFTIAGCGSKGGPAPVSESGGSPRQTPTPTVPATPPDSGVASPSGPGPVAVNPYETAGVTDPTAFRQMFESLKQAVANNEQEKAAEFALYPIRVNAGKVTVEVKTKEEFVKQYDRIFTENIRKALAVQDADSLFVNAKGVMAGNGAVWFGATSELPQRYGIITVNAGAAK